MFTAVPPPPTRDAAAQQPWRLAKRQPPPRTCGTRIRSCHRLRSRHRKRGNPLVPCRAGGRLLSRLHRRGVATPDCCSHAPFAARDVCAAPLAPGHPREGRQALDRSAAADALPLKAALLHLDTDFKLHRVSHRPRDAAVPRPTTRRVLVVRGGRAGTRRQLARNARACDSVRWLPVLAQRWHEQQSGVSVG